MRKNSTANFICKAVNVDELKSGGATQKFVIEDVVGLSGAEYEHFCSGLLKNWEFITRHTRNMWQDPDGTRHCILVAAPGRTDGILVESQGYDYARYAAYVEFTPMNKFVVGAHFEIRGWGECEYVGRWGNETYVFRRVNSDALFMYTRGELEELGVI